MKRRMKRTWRDAAGFTLVELIVVIAIMGVLAAGGSVAYSGYVKNAAKKADIALMSNVNRAVETASNSGYVGFELADQYTEGMEMPVGFVVVSNTPLEVVDGKEIYAQAKSNDTENDPLGKALAAVYGADYGSTLKLGWDGWTVGDVSSSNLYNATPHVIDMLDKSGDLMLKLDGLIDMTAGEYENTGELLLGVADRIADFNKDGKIEAADKTAFVAEWANSYNKGYNNHGFALNDGQEYYSAVRIGYSSAFAEYVRAHYDGEKDKNTLANEIAEFGEPSGELAYRKAYDIAYGNGNGTIYKVAYNAAYYNPLSWKNDTKAKEAGIAACKASANTAKATAEEAAGDTKFPWASTEKAFECETFAGYGDEKCKALFDEWVKGQDEKDAAFFYDTMLTVATDGGAHADENGSEDVVNWFNTQAENYSKNYNDVKALAKDKSAIVMAVYYKNGLLTNEIYPLEADARYEG